MRPVQRERSEKQVQARWKERIWFDCCDFADLFFFRFVFLCSQKNGEEILSRLVVRDKHIDSIRPVIEDLFAYSEKLFLAQAREREAVRDLKLLRFEMRDRLAENRHMLHSSSEPQLIGK